MSYSVFVMYSMYASKCMTYSIRICVYLITICIPDTKSLYVNYSWLSYTYFSVHIIRILYTYYPSGGALIQFGLRPRHI